MASRAERFAALFDGLKRAYGRYVIPVNASSDGRGKIEGEAATWHRGFSTKRWEEHLDGTAGLGINPCRDDGTVRFVAIDVDVYDVDLATYVERVRRFELPLVVCRSKSGGPHLYAFFLDDVPAALAVERAHAWAVLLGHPGCEIFPKNDSFEKVEDGNWINMPYFGGDRTVRYGHGPDGNALDPDTFLDYAEGMRVTKRFLDAWEMGDPPIEDVGNEDWYEAPPCLVSLGNTGFPGGVRNNAMLGVAIYLKKRYPEGWQDKVREYNDRYMHPSKARTEIEGIIRSVSRRDYNYSCSKSPFVERCDRPRCLMRRFGVASNVRGSPAAFPLDLGPLYKIMSDPPTWRWLVNHHPIDLSTEQIRNQRLFLLRVFETIDVIVPPISGMAFDALVTSRLPPQAIPVPPDGTFGGVVETSLHDFCTRGGVTSAQTLDSILIGQTFTFGGRTCFLPRYFYEYLHLRKVGYQMVTLMRVLTDLGIQWHTEDIKGKPTTYWSVAERKAQTEDHAVPRSPKKGPF